MGRDLTLEEKQRKIDDFWTMNYNKLYLKSTSKYQFENNLEKTIPSQLNDILNKDKQAQDYFNAQKKGYLSKFELENNLRNKDSEEEKKRQEIQKDRDNIDEIIKANYEEAKKKENKNDFQEVFDNNTKIQKLIKKRIENKDYYNQCIQLYLNQYSNEWDAIKKNIDDFFTSNYKRIFDESNDKNNLKELLEKEGKKYKEKNYFKNKMKNSVHSMMK